MARYPQGAILDEVQTCPALLSYLKQIIDRDPVPGRWVPTGSYNLSVVQSTSQSLAGRAALLHLLPLTWGEEMRFAQHPTTLNQSMLLGGHPHGRAVEQPPAARLDLRAVGRFRTGRGPVQPRRVQRRLLLSRQRGP